MPRKSFSFAGGCILYLALLWTFAIVSLAMPLSVVAAQDQACLKLSKNISLCDRSFAEQPRNSLSHTPTGSVINFQTIGDDNSEFRELNAAGKVLFVEAYLTKLMPDGEEPDVQDQPCFVLIEGAGYGIKPEIGQSDQARTALAQSFVTLETAFVSQDAAVVFTSAFASIAELHALKELHAAMGQSLENRGLSDEKLC